MKICRLRPRMGKTSHTLRIGSLRGRALLWGAAAISFGVGGGASARSDACDEVDAALLQWAQVGTDRDALMALAPYFSPAQIRVLGARIPGADARGRLAMIDALGETRGAAALAVLRPLPPAEGRRLRLARSLALLALGDGSETGTVAAALAPTEPEARRRFVAQRLVRMAHWRPRALLQSYARDADPWLRFWASEYALSRGWRSGTARVRELLQTDDAKLSLRAARALLTARQIPDGSHPAWPRDLTLAARAMALVRAPASAGRLWSRLAAVAPLQRAAGFVAFLGLAEGEASLAAAVKSWPDTVRTEGPGPAMRVMAGEHVALSSDDRTWLFDLLTAAAAVHNGPTVFSRAAGRHVESALREGAAAPEAGLRRAAEALAALQPAAGLAWARRALVAQSPGGRAVAADVLFGHGDRTDVRALLAVAAPPRGWRAARASAALCRR